MPVKKIMQFGKVLVLRLLKHDVAGSSAQMSYYLIMAFFPFVIFLITTLSYTALFENILPETMEQMLPEETYLFLMGIVDELLASRSGSLLSISMFTTIFFASKGINAIIAGMNKSYLLSETRGFVKKNLLSVFFTLLLALAINLLFLLIIMGGVISRGLADLLDIPMIAGQIWILARLGLSLVFVFFVISTVYMYFPNLKKTPQLKEVWQGSLFATLGWIISSFAFAFYVENFSRYNIIYGSITGIIVLLLWLFLSSFILLTGAEINALRKTMEKR